MNLFCLRRLAWLGGVTGLGLGAILGSGACAWGQAQGDQYGFRVQELHPQATPSPFPLDVSTGRVQELRFLAPEQMSSADRELAAANMVEIARRAALQGFHLSSSGTEAPGWEYEQAVCPVFPNHLVLEFSRSDGAGSVSLFSAVIPRAGSGGHVRVIPVRRRSYSLLTPASENALTIHDFNQVVQEEPGGHSPDWLTLVLCYAALAGGHVNAALEPDAATKFPMYPPAALTVSGKGGAEVRFTDTTPGNAMLWDMTFAQDGHLDKVRHGLPKGLVERAVPASAAEVKGTPIKGTAVEIPAPGK